MVATEMPGKGPGRLAQAGRALAQGVKLRTHGVRTVGADDPEKWGERRLGVSARGMMGGEAQAAGGPVASPLPEALSAVPRSL